MPVFATEISLLGSYNEFLNSFAEHLIKNIAHLQNSKNVVLVFATDIPVLRSYAYCCTLTIHYSLLTAHSSQLTAHVSRLTIHDSRFTIHYSLLTTLTSRGTAYISSHFHKDKDHYVPLSVHRASQFLRQLQDDDRQKLQQPYALLLQPCWCALC